ncbi:MAG: hypothetical protein V8Q84_03325 [Bilophila sp.]
MPVAHRLVSMHKVVSLSYPTLEGSPRGTHPPQAQAVQRAPSPKCGRASSQPSSPARARGGHLYPRAHPASTRYTRLADCGNAPLARSVGIENINMIAALAQA